MNITLTCDNNYVPYCGIVIISLLENNKGEDINLYVIGHNLSYDSKEAFYKIGKKYKVEIQIIDMDNNLLDKCPPTDKKTHFTMAVYIRLFLASIFPDIDKMMYLDSDVIVKQNLKALWDIDIQNYALAGIIDPYLIEIKKTRFEGYINSGILLINLDYWRKNGLEQIFFDYFNDGGKTEYVDQDVFNYTLKGKIKHLPLKYNVQSSFYNTDGYSLSLQNELKEATSDAAIIHFTSLKPWLRDSIHPETKIFRRYAKLSEWKWKDISYWGPAIGGKNRRKYRFYKKRFLIKLGLKQQDNMIL